MEHETKLIKVRLKEDMELFGKKLYAGEEIEVSQEVYQKIADKVEVVNDANTV